MARHHMGTLICWKDGKNHLVGNTTRITTSPAGLFAVDFEEEVKFDMNTSGTITITRSGNTYKARLAKRSEQWAKDFVYAMCNAPESEWDRYKVV